MVLIFVIAAALFCGEALAAPFPSADHNPLLGGFTFSAPAHVPTSSSAQVTFNWSSTASILRAGNDLLVIDAEVREWRAQFEHAFGQRFIARAQLPFRSIGGGSFDRVIEGWHDLFGLPDGSRVGLPHNRLHLELRQGGRTVFNHRNTHFSGMGDAALDVGWQLRKNDASATSLWLGATLPTGDDSKFLGSGGLVSSLIVAHTQTLNDFELFAHAGVQLGDHDFIHRKSAVWLGMLGIDYRATSRATFTAQLDGHSAAFKNARFDLMDSAYILTLGGDYAFANGWRLQLGVAEDVKVQSTADVAVTLSLGKGLGVRR